MNKRGARRETGGARREAEGARREAGGARREAGGATSPVPQGSSPARDRLQKILSAAGVASRRVSEELIASGRVTVNGEPVTALGTKANLDTDDIRVDGRRVKHQQRRWYILLNKPRGYVTTRSDPQGRKTVLDLLKEVREYIYPVGRLDYDSEGLLLLTNDGDLAARLTHPRHEVERVYEAKVRGVPDPHALNRLEKGIRIEGRRTAPATADMKTRASTADVAHSVVQITIREGRNRQVRDMFDAVGHPVMRLKRVRIGPIADPNLPPGHWRELTAREVDQLRRATRASERR